MGLFLLLRILVERIVQFLSSSFFYQFLSSFFRIGYLGLNILFSLQLLVLVLNN
jgi:hypothetical protein